MPTNPPQIKSHWRKLVDSFRAAHHHSYLPEYAQHSERATNYRYYR